MNKFETNLRAQLEGLRLLFLQKAQDFATAEFARLETVLSNGETAFLIQSGVCFTDGKIDRKEYHKKTLYNAQDRFKAIRKTVNAGVAAFVEKELKTAANHFEDCVLKIVYRVEQKGLSQDCTEILSAYVGVNLETTFTDGAKTVKAQTVLAEGPIQRPHLRYLVK